MMKRILCLSLFVCFAIASWAQQLPALTYSKKPAVLKGSIQNVSTVDSIEVYYKPVAGDTEETKRVPVTAGKFNVEADIRVTQQVQITLLDKAIKDDMLRVMVNVIMMPGETLELNYDAKAADANKPAWKAKGCSEKLNADMANYASSYVPLSLFSSINGVGLQQFKGKTMQDFQAKLDDILANGIKTLEEDKRLSPVFREYTTVQYRLIYALMLSNADRLLAYANGGKGDYKFTPDMFDSFLATKAVESNGALYGRFGDLTTEISTLVKKCVGKETPIPACSKQLLEAIKLMAQLDEYKPLSGEQQQQLTTIVPNYDDIILAKHQQVTAKLKENESNHLYAIKELSDTLTGPRVFQGIIEQYKGKPILVDFWATWCGPCRAAMKTVLPVKEELKGKCAFVYVTGVTSPRSTWNATIPDIHGDHFYVTESQWDTLLKQFESQGIPTYVIVDSKGNIQQKHIGFPGVDVIREELLKGM